MRAFKSHILSVLLLLSSYQRFANAVAGVIRFCDTRERKYTINSLQCPGGTHLNQKKLGDAVKNGHMWNCICTTGSWFIYRKLCQAQDTAGRFTYGDLTCFNPRDFSNNEVLGAIHLGSSENRDLEEAPLLFTSYKSGLLIRENNLKRKWRMARNKRTRYAGDLSAIRLNPSGDWTLKEENTKTKVCLMAPEEEEPVGVFVYRIPDFYTEEMKGLISLKTKWYESNANHSQEFLFSMERGCDETEGDDNIRSVFPENVNEDVIPAGTNSQSVPLSNECRECYGTGMDLDLDEEKESGVSSTESCVPEDLSEIDLLSRDVDLQSSRMGLYWAKAFLDTNHIDSSYEYVRDDLQEISFLTKAAMIAYGACNMNYIPKEFYQYFLMMFKQLLSEAFQKYAPKGEIKGQALSEINEALKQCMDKTVPFEFTVSKDCPAKYTSVQHKGVRRNIKIAEKDKADPAKHDFLLEFIWKLKTFMHYHCFDEFKDKTYLHDLLQQSIEAVFTEDLLLRWVNPSLSLKMYQRIFDTKLDLSATMQNFDFCLYATHNYSKFEPLLRRPIDQPHRSAKGSRTVTPEPPELFPTTPVSNNGLSEDEDGPLLDVPDIIPGVDLSDKFYTLANGSAHCMTDLKWLMSFVKPDMTTCW